MEHLDDVGAVIAFSPEVLSPFGPYTCFFLFLIDFSTVACRSQKEKEERQGAAESRDC